MTIATIWYRSASDRGYTQVRERIAEVLADLQESLSGIRIISAHNRRRHNVQQHRNIVGEYQSANQYTAHVSAVYGPPTDFIGAAGQAVVLLVGGNMVLNGSLTIGELTAFVLYLAAFFAPIQQLVQLYTTYQSGQAAVDKLQELLATHPSVPERVDAVDLPPIAGHVVLDHVSFGYTPGQESLHDVTLDIAPGETFALVGATGAGKSTIAKLVTRFYDPTEGTVHDRRTRPARRHVRIAATSARRRAAGGVPVRRLGARRTSRSPDLTPPTTRSTRRVAPSASTSSSSASPRGSTRGCTNGARRSRRANASCSHWPERSSRAPRVLVLDEATANLDLRSEAQVERGLDALLEGRTAILIAHRLATAMRADRIAVVDDGRVVELGSHEELTALGGQYATMFDTWQRHMSGHNGDGNGQRRNGDGARH